MVRRCERLASIVLLTCLERDNPMRICISMVLFLMIMISNSPSQTAKTLKTIQDLNSKKWELIKPYEMTEEMLILFFGTPDLVTLHCSYDDQVWSTKEQYQHFLRHFVRLDE